MPQLSDKDYAKFSQMLEELESEVPGMKDTPKSFMSDMLDKNKLYGERVFVSPKQFAWIEQLHQEFVGDTDHGTDIGSGDNPSHGIDDDIPF